MNPLHLQNPQFANQNYSIYNCFAIPPILFSIVDDIDTNCSNVNFILQVAWNKYAQTCCDHRLNIRGQQVQSTRTFKTSICQFGKSCKLFIHKHK
jgi:hypothetical protein